MGCGQSRRCAGKEQLWEHIDGVLAGNRQAVIAIDGCSGSGKTTLAEEMKRRYGLSVVHMDDFFLRPEQRNLERRQEPGGNIDYERFEEEVLPWLGSGRAFSYRRFDCAVMRLGEKVEVPPGPVVLEGVYSCHPRFLPKIDHKIFLTLPREEQLRRIERRGGTEKLKRFLAEWIPLEDRYFSAFSVAEQADEILTIE